MLALCAPVAMAQTRRDSELGDKQRDLRETQRRLLEERAKAADAKRREASVLSDLEATEKRLGDKRRQIAVLGGRMKRAQGDIGDLERDIAALHRRRATQEEALARRLVVLYKLERQGGVLPLVFAGLDPVHQAVQLFRRSGGAQVQA
jgi:septal ring factor EnvC (AmiA/AmiB activator)